MSKERLELIHFIGSYPLLTAPQLSRLAGRSEKAVQNTLAIFSARTKPVVQKIRKDMYSRYHYALSKWATTEFGGNFVDLKNRSTYFLDHDELINEVLIDLSFKYKVEVSIGGRKAWDEQIHPDRFLILNNGAKKRAFFLEAETGKNRDDDFIEKIEGYVAYWQKHFPKDPPKDWKHPKYRVRTFTVLTVCTSEQKAADLAATCAPSIPEKDQKLYLFSSLPVQDCIVAHEPARYPLMPV